MAYAFTEYDLSEQGIETGREFKNYNTPAYEALKAAWNAASALDKEMFVFKFNNRQCCF